MPEFLAETYTPELAPSTPAPSADDVARAAEHASSPRAPVRFLGVVALPGEETCFWLYQGPAAAALRSRPTSSPDACRSCPIKRP